MTHAQKIQIVGQAWLCTSVIPATEETEAGGFKSMAGPGKSARSYLKTN
jgi:hypothetical protein